MQGGSEYHATLLPISIVRRIFTLLGVPATFSDSRADGFVFPAHLSRGPPPGARPGNVERISKVVSGVATDAASGLPPVGP